MNLVMNAPKLIPSHDIKELDLHKTKVDWNKKIEYV